MPLFHRIFFYNDISEKEEFLKIKENDEIVRREKIVQAEALIQKLKPGPRDLQSAAMLSEVLKCRNIQRSIQNEFENAEKERVEKENARQINEILPWMMDDVKNKDLRKNRDKYKHEIFENIQDRERERQDFKRKTQTFEKAMRERTENYHKTQIEKEREILQRKREALRKNALEAMQMVEQRRLRKFALVFMLYNFIYHGKTLNYKTGKINLSHLKL